MQEIARKLRCSVHKVQYWLGKHAIPSRSISDAVYRKYHLHGDPFTFTPPRTTQEAILFGIGIGLYWGEGTKADRHSVRLGNTNPAIIDSFLRFMTTFFHVKRQDFRFSLQIFSDTPIEQALDFWRKRLKLRRAQFYRVTVTRSGAIGTYRQKSKCGVLTLYYHNRKLRDLIIGLMPP